MRTNKGIEDLIVGIIITSKDNENPERSAAKEIISTLIEEENLNIPPIEELDEEEMLKEIEPPIGDFILKNATGIMGNNGVYYHYADVCNLLKSYHENELKKIKKV